MGVKRRGARLMVAQEFSVKFDGPAVAEGRIPVSELAPSLLALGELFQHAKEIAEPDAPPVTLEVRAYGGGSFENFLVVTAGITHLLTTSPVNALTNLLTIVGSGRGVIAALRALRGQNIARTESAGRDQVRAYNENGDNFVSTGSVINVYNNFFARDAAVRFVQPLQNPDFSTIDVNVPEEPLSVTRAEVLAIETAQEEPVPERDADIDQTFPTLVTLIQPSLEEGYMWRINYADNRIRASFDDEEYLDKIKRKEVGFVAGDTLRVDLRMRQWATDGKPTTKWSIVKVRGHMHAADTKPSALPFPAEGEEAKGDAE